MKTLLVSLGLIALAGSASAYTRVVIAPPALVIGSPVCRPVEAERVVRPAPYCTPVAVFHGRREVVRVRPEYCPTPFRHHEQIRGREAGRCYESGRGYEAGRNFEAGRGFESGRGGFRR